MQMQMKLGKLPLCFISPNDQLQTMLLDVMEITTVSKTLMCDEQEFNILKFAKTGDFTLKTRTKSP